MEAQCRDGRARVETWPQRHFHTNSDMLNRRTNVLHFEQFHLPLAKTADDHSVSVPAPACFCTQTDTSVAFTPRSPHRPGDP